MKKPVATKSPAEQVVKDIRRATRKLHSSEEKIRIVLSGLRGVSIAKKKGEGFPPPVLVTAHHSLQNSLQTSVDQAVKHGIGAIARCQLLALTIVAGIGGDGVVGAGAE